MLKTYVEKQDYNYGSDGSVDEMIKYYGQDFVQNFLDSMYFSTFFAFLWFCC